MELKTGRCDGAPRIFPARRLRSSEPCNALVAGTVVLTLDGALPVEHLAPGDRVITRDSGTAVLARVVCDNRRTDLVAIRAGTLGTRRPDRNMVLPAGQDVLLRDWRARLLFGASRALVPADRLADGLFVRKIGRHDVALVELRFDAPHILYGDGLELAAAHPVAGPG